MSHLTPVPNDPEELEAWLAQVIHGPGQPMFEQFVNSEIELPAAPEEASELTVTVTLMDTEPPVWRRLSLPGDVTLDRFHDVLQVAMGWTDSHLHRFRMEEGHRSPHFVSDFDLEEGVEGTPEDSARLDQVLREVGDRLHYEYDFGDGWEHEVVLEDVGDLGPESAPRCLAGGRACPPEDVGGVPGFEQLVAWYAAGRTPEALPPSFESVEHALGWLPPDYDPETFDVEDVTLRLQAERQAGEVLDRLRPEALQTLGRLTPLEMARVSEWLGRAGRESLSPADVEDLARPWQTLLTVVDGGVRLSSAGWLPPSTVQQLCPVLGVDPILAGKANRESNVRPLAMFRKAAQHVGLLHTSRGILMPTVAGIRYRDDPAGLWRHVAPRLPVGRSELKRDVGWFTLLALAGGVDRREVFDAVAELCVAAGWQTEDGEPIDRWDVVELVWPTICAAIGPRWNSREEWPRWVPAAAADVVFAPQPS